MGSMGVAVVSYNTRDLLRTCLQSALAAGAAEVVVADNGSRDGSIEMVTREFPTVTLLEDRTNPGYGAAANAAIARCRTPYVLLLNADTVVAPEALHALTAYLDAHPQAAIVGPKLVNPDGTLQRSCHQFPTPLLTLLDYSWMGKLLGRVPGLRLVYVASFAHDRARRIDWVTGAALAIRRSAFETVGGFDRRFFMYFEEVDLSYRLRRAHWETHYAPVTDVVHVSGASTRAQPTAMYVQQLAAGVTFYQHHRSRASVVLARWAFGFAIRSNMAGDMLRRRFERREAARLAAAERVDNWTQILAQFRSRLDEADGRRN